MSKCNSENNWNWRHEVQSETQSFVKLLETLGEHVSVSGSTLCHRRVSGVCRAFLVTSSTSPFTSSLVSSFTFCFFFTFYFFDVVDYKPAHFHWGAGSPGHKELSPQVKITEVYVEYTLKSSTTRALPSVWSFWMCAEDEPITLKEKACRSVCSRCQWVMIERGNPLSAVTQVTSKVKKFRDKNTENEQSRRNSRPYWNCLSWRFTRRKADLIIAYWRRWWKEVWSRIYESRILKRETEIVTHDGQCSEVDSCSFRHDINKRAKNDTAESVSEFFMQQDEKTRSPRGRMSLWKNVSMAMQDYVKGMCIDSFWKVAPSRILVLQDSKVEADLVKSALMRIVSLMNNLLKGPRGIISSHVEEEWFARKRMATCCQLWQVTSDRGDPISIVTPVMSWSEDLFNADHRTHGIWVVFQDMKPPKSILRKSSDMKKPIKRVKITKAIARRTKIRYQNSSLGYSEVFKNWMKRSGSRKFILLEHKIIYFFMNSYWSRDLREAHKSQWNGRIDDIWGFYIRHHCQDTGIAKWKELYEWFKRFSGCWINTLWKFPRDQSTSVFHTSSNSWMDVETFFVTPKSWSKTTKTDFCQINNKNFLVGENLDRHSTTRLFAYWLLMVEETNHSSSLSWLSTSRRWWIVWILENQWQSSETFPASLGWRKVTNRMEEEDKKKISVLSRFFRNNSELPSSPRSLWTQPYESFIAGQCRYSGRYLRVL